MISWHGATGRAWVSARGCAAAWARARAARRAAQRTSTAELGSSLLYDSNACTDPPPAPPAPNAPPSAPPGASPGAPLPSVPLPAQPPPSAPPRSRDLGSFPMRAFPHPVCDDSGGRAPTAASRKTGRHAGVWHAQRSGLRDTRERAWYHTCGGTRARAVGAWAAYGTRRARARTRTRRSRTGVDAR